MLLFCTNSFPPSEICGGEVEAEREVVYKIQYIGIVFSYPIHDKDGQQGIKLNVTCGAIKYFQTNWNKSQTYPQK